MKEIIERLIRTGKTTAEIQSEIIEFPDDITTEYLQKIGFEETQAIKLKWKLRQNDRICENETRAEKGRRALVELGGYEFSANANPDFVLMDTCALLNKKGRDVIEKSSRVVVIDSVLQEIDERYHKTNIKRNKKPADYKKLSILRTGKKEIFNQAKYKKRLDIPKDGMTYCDEKILYYLEKLPPEQRPTLLTADFNFASRAGDHGFDYIFIKGSTNNKKEKEVQTTESKKNLNGIRFIVTGDQITVKGLNKKARTYFVTGKKAKLIQQNETKQIKSFDFIIMVLRQKSNREVRLRKISIVNNQFEIDEEIVKYVNEIYQFDLPEEIQEEARRLLLE